MALYCMVSPGGAPGATTTALGVALTWPSPVLLAECDPMGRRVLPGYAADRLSESAGPGLLGLSMVAESGPHARLPLEDYVVSVPGEKPLELLHGVRDPRHGVRLGPLWGRLSEALVARRGDVIADLGRIGGRDTPNDLLRAADTVIMVLRPTLAQVDAVRPRLDALTGLVGERTTVGLCLVADGPYGAAEVERALGAPVLAELPWAPADARVLSDGARPRRTFRTSLLLRSFTCLGRRLRATSSSASTNSGRADEEVLSGAVAAGGGDR
ncbi:hypothetical protein [Actinomadura violacea]|uniref:MinD-like ATPase involved in chromosome partitioning or flagellar assembly n=1 Tax=Actinomadura violacea TaxID=2819934 RepID=A0ABS3SAG8_9ACTN|nr:hypothetical protein [Actinomadura violacea]MBO2465990.1 hypothetical protein [Actinomadura violacea]